MIAQNQVDKARRLLATGTYSQRQIAELTKISRGTISKIAKGKRRDHFPVKKAEECGPFEGPIARCPECGGRVHMPCRFCQARRFASGDLGMVSIFDTESFESGAPLDLELQGESLRRYEEIHQKRLLQDETVPESEEWEEEEKDDLLAEIYFESLLKEGEVDVGQFLT